MKAFISQPMKDLSNEEIRAEREKAIASLKEKYGDDIEIIDSFFENAPHDAKPLWFLGKSIELLSTADVAYFCKGWENARGCRIENTCAIEYGLEVIEDYR
jgi:hypothetical protein